MSDMKTRDFTRETYEILIKEIEKIDSENWSKVTDFIGDIFLRIGKFTHFISLDEEMQNVREYQKSVLDMNNTTKSQLKKIFNQTNTTDHVMAGKIKHVNEQQEPYNQKLKQLCDMIQLIRGSTLYCHRFSPSRLINERNNNAIPTHFFRLNQFHDKDVLEVLPAHFAHTFE